MQGRTQETPFGITALTMELKRTVEGGYSKIYVEGEICGWRPYPSGHVYFTLKDSNSQISAVMFKSNFERCKSRSALRDGAKVLVYGNVSIYPPRGSYQFVALAAKLVGEGDLMRQYMELKEKLEAEGLFDPAKKRPLPFLPRRIGLVTSTAGAVVHDMCRVLTRRFDNIEIRIFPASVQGTDAPPTLVAGVKYFNGCDDWKADVVIVARGGGSFEDLFCFNDESLVRVVASSAIPIISAVGHETDFTLCDFAADVRAGTPSIAAEIVVPDKRELVNRIKSASSSVASALRGKYEWFAQRLDSIGDRFSHVLELRLSRAESRLTELKAKIGLLSPYSVLERGYSLTTDSTGAIVSDASHLAAGDILTTRFKTGSVESMVEKIF